MVFVLAFFFCSCVCVHGNVCESETYVANLPLERKSCRNTITTCKHLILTEIHTCILIHCFSDISSLSLSRSLSAAQIAAKQSMMLVNGYFSFQNVNIFMNCLNIVFVISLFVDHTDCSLWLKRYSYPWNRCGSMIERKYLNPC